MAQNTIAVIFDFDETLAPDSTSSFLESLGIDVAHFWQERVNRLKDTGWDPVPAYLYMMIKESQSREASERITKGKLMAWGQELKFYPGVTRIFAELKTHLEQINPEAELEFYLISSGIEAVLKSTAIAKQFSDIWACDFHYNDSDEIEFPKRVVSFTDKTRYIFHIAKGLIGAEYESRPFDVNRKVSDKDLRIPFDQMIVVGDGMTDIPCFSLVKGKGGWALGIYDPTNQDKWGRAWGFVEQDRVSNLVPADYRAQSALNHSLKMALSAIATKMKLKSTAYQG